MDKPLIICFCGSVGKASEEFLEAEYQTLIKGHIGLFPTSLKSVKWLFEKKDVSIKDLKDLHKRKIEIADRVVILNVGGYIGPTTQLEIDYALSIGKTVEFLESEVGNG